MRTLSDFGPLSPLETALLANSKAGLETVAPDFTKERPAQRSEANAVRGAFVRFIALGGDKDAPTHEKGVQLEGAYIHGAIDLHDAAPPHPLVLRNCFLDTRPEMNDAVIPTLLLEGSASPGLLADRATFKGGVYLNDGFTATGGVSLLGARIGGDLSCDSATLNPPEGPALNAAGVEVGGYVFLRDAFSAEGEVSFLGAQIGRSLECTNAALRNAQGAALTLDSATIKGTLFLTGKLEIAGAVDLTAAEIGLISDNTDKKLWPDAGQLYLDQATYRGFAGDCVHLSARDRLDWLALQHSGRQKFTPQPYEQLAKVYRGAGRRTDARTVLIEKERLMRRNGRIKGVLGRAAHVVSGWVVGYGYRTWLAFVWLFGFWLLGVVVYDRAYEEGAMLPTGGVLSSAAWTGCQTAKPTVTACWLATPQGADYQRFNRYAYALDVLLPVVTLHQQSAWLPQPERGRTALGRGARIFLWAHIALGWGLTALAVAGFTGLVKRE